MGSHQRMLLQSQLRHLDFLDQEIAQLDEEVAARMGPFEGAIQQLDGVTGVGPQTAEEVLAEIGLDMSRFPSEAHLSSWAHVCPGDHESAGKRKSGAAGRGNPWLRSALVEAARSASRSRGTYLAAQYHRLAARRGDKRAILAVAHTILVAIYHLLRHGTTFHDLGGNYFDQRDQQATIRRSVRRLERLGYKVALQAA